VHGATLLEVFENSAFAMFDLMFGIGDLVGERRIQVEVEAATVEELLVDWLSTLLFEAETNDLVFCSFSLESISDGRAVGSATGVPLAGVELAGPPVKAVTYHDLAIRERPGGWSARIVFDV
jgi:SHS2 domain-containing protein